MLEKYSQSSRQCFFFCCRCHHQQKTPLTTTMTANSSWNQRLVDGYEFYTDNSACSATMAELCRQTMLERNGKIIWNHNFKNLLSKSAYYTFWLTLQRAFLIIHILVEWATHSGVSFWTHEKKTSSWRAICCVEDWGLAMANCYFSQPSTNKAD